MAARLSGGAWASRQQGERVSIGGALRSAIEGRYAHRSTDVGGVLANAEAWERLKALSAMPSMYVTNRNEDR